MRNETKNGIALICDKQGIVQSVLRDDLDLASCAPPGQSVLHLADPVDGEKARQFFIALQSRPTACDWEIFVRWKGELKALHFSGGKIEAGFLVVAALTSEGLGRLFEEAMGVQKNEAANARQATVEEDIWDEASHANKPDRNRDLFDELSRVNSDLANLQRDIFKKNVELARLNEQKTRFLGIAAHELRSPLSVILTYSEFLEEESQLPAEQHEFVSVIKQTSDYLLGLINNLLDVSQIDSGQLNIDVKPTDLAALARHNVALNQVLAGKKHIRLKLVEETPLPILLLDPWKMEQVLYNLLSNAVKFSQPQSEVVVRLGREGDQAAITVVDQGPGIPENQQEKLFKPFSRTEVKSPGGERGAGLGLSIVRRIVEGHHGTVGVKSVVGRGSSFKVRLPIVPISEGLAAGERHEHKDSRLQIIQMSPSAPPINSNLNSICL